MGLHLLRLVVFLKLLKLLEIGVAPDPQGTPPDWMPGGVWDTGGGMLW